MKLSFKYGEGSGHQSLVILRYNIRPIVCGLSVLKKVTQVVLPEKNFGNSLEQKKIP